MDIILSVNHSESNKINKTITDSYTFTGTLREDCSIISPVILMEIDDPSGYNYAEIPEFGRKYFIRDIVSIRNNLWQINMNVDVLASFADEIKACSVIVSDSETTGADNYLAGTAWQSKVKELTDIISFSNGLLSAGEFILITAGG